MHDLRLPALAQRGRVQTLSRPVRAHGRRLPLPEGNHADGLQPVRFLVRPLRKWLDERGVVFALNTTVTDLVIVEAAGDKTVEQIVFRRGGRGGEIMVRPIDRVLVTLGSMTEGSSLDR